MNRYVFRTILQLSFTGLAYVLAPVVAIFCKDDGYLPNCLAWFQTQDAPLDAGVRDGYAGFDPNDSRWWNRTKWLWRNPAYGFCYWPMGIPYVPEDWTIEILTRDATGRLTEFKASTSDPSIFCHTKSNGMKRGYKLWWALGNDDKLLPVMPADKGPDNRIPICYTPAHEESA